MVLKILTVVLFAIWLVLLLIGKGGFVHLILFGFIATAAIELAAVYRSRMIDSSSR